VNDYRKVPVTVIVVDSGPLISLAACKQLHLLGAFDCPIRIADVAMAECLRDLTKIGAVTLSEWFSSLNGSFYTVIDTPFMQNWLDAVEQEDAGDRSLPSKGIGDAAAAWILNRLASNPWSNELSLLLTEDANFGDVVIPSQNPGVHILSTRAFLRTLQNFHLIPSAAEIVDAIGDAGRNLARYYADRPGRLGPGVRTSWSDPLGKGPGDL
jgi:hypothetical protein